ncbi:S1 family peptidase [Streptomyces sp. WM4235]|uniref:S1 family peptidase n=1 Tax=Streptomyces sp. WM4235 TaxID=1415551 RepID=UPI000ABB7ADD|nr:S1 family peptidase [Streptomyces sp. WM4235]
MKRTAKSAIGLGAVGLALLTVTAPGAQAEPASPRRTEAQIAAMDPTQRGELLEPLRQLADAVAAAGKSKQPDTYAGVRIDAPNNVVHVYVTDRSRTAKLIEAARQTDAGIDTKKIAVEEVRTTLAALHDARARLLAKSAAKSLPYEIHSVAVNAEASSLDVAVDAPAKAIAGRPKALGVDDVALNFIQGQKIEPASWSDVKWHDSSPFIAGDVITNGGHYCSAGLPAVRKSDNVRVMVTAGHCFGNGERIYTGAGSDTLVRPLLRWSERPDRKPRGYPGMAPNWDAETLIGADNSADVSESTAYAPVTSYAYSHNGDPDVCQSGAASCFMQQGTVCGIRVINDDVMFSLSNGWTARGVQGTRLPGNPWTVAHGDSGTMVYTKTGSTRQARGVVSALSSPYQTNAGSYVYWTEATDIFNHFGLKLNPTT